MAEKKEYDEKVRSWSDLLKYFLPNSISQLFRRDSVGNLVVDTIGYAEKVTSWSDLPNDALCEVFSRLFPRERVVFQSVCKTWSSIGTIVSQRFEVPGNLECAYPYLMFSNNRFFHPIYEECHYMGSPRINSATALSGPIYDKFHHMDILDIPGVLVGKAKDGWLLMVRSKKVFFINPYTREKKQLPCINGYPKSMYFSLSPTSEEWFVIAGTTESGEHGLHTIKCGDNEWSYSELTLNEESFTFSHCNAVVFEGLYYFLGEDAKLFIYNPKTRACYFHVPPISNQLMGSVEEQYMLLNDGKLLAVFEGFHGSLICVCQWDPSNWTWETIESLGDKVLFVSRPQSLLTTATSKRTSNNIYFPRIVGSHCLFYSLTTKRLHRHIFAMDISYDDFGESKEYLGATWIT